MLEYTVVDHFSWLPKEVIQGNEGVLQEFDDEQLVAKVQEKNNAPWFAYIINYEVTGALLAHNNPYRWQKILYDA